MRPEQREPGSASLNEAGLVHHVLVREIAVRQKHQVRFEPLDERVFRSVALARQVGEQGLTYPAVYNAANEQAVEAFHRREIGFNQIVDLIERVVSSHEPEKVLSLESVLAAEKWARDRADGIIARAC